MDARDRAAIWKRVRLLLDELQSYQLIPGPLLLPLPTWEGQEENDGYVRPEEE